jgi:hypothetical protein
MTPLEETLRAAVPLLPGPFREENAGLFVPEHLSRLAGRLLALAEHGVPAEPPPPHFAAECTPPLAPAWEVVRGPVEEWQGSADQLAPPLLGRWADALAAAGTRNLLLLLGQRLTPASLTDARAIPPTRARLLAAAAVAHNPADGLTVAARALAKHAHRAPGAFWGEAGGPVVGQNARALHVLNDVLDRATWWNVFGHFAHDTVFEARVPSGHGARWGRGGDEFIGFLEPFDEEKLPPPDPGTAGLS